MLKNTPKQILNKQTNIKYEVIVNYNDGTSLNSVVTNNPFTPTVLSYTDDNLANITHSSYVNNRLSYRYGNRTIDGITTGYLRHR